MTRKFEAVLAVRKAVPLLIGIAGPPGAGKTYSALELATGIKEHRGGPIVALDTERNRMLAYAPPAGVKADGVNHFDFMHVPFSPPFGSMDFLDAVMQQRVHKPSCIIIDSFSEEHEGEGGLLDFHDKELDRMGGDDWAKRERVGQAAWIKPKAKRLEMMNGLFQIMTPLIFCFRAREKTKQITNDRGKQVPTNIGWTPIAPPEVVHNMTLFALLPIKSDGVPMWKGNTAYEDFSIKLPRAFQGLFPEGERITRKMGVAMSTWSLGDQTLDGLQAEDLRARESAKKQEAPKATVPQPAPTVEASAPSAEPASPASDAGTVADPGTPGSGEPTTAAEAPADSGTKTSRKQSKDGSYSVLVQFAEPGALPDAGETYMIGHVTYDGPAWVGEVERHKEGSLLFWRDGVDAGRIDKATAPSTIWAYMDHRPRPTSTASAPTAEAEAVTSASTTPASPSSQEAVSGPTAGQRQSSAPVGPDVPPEFAAYALALAKAEDWPTGIRDGAIKPLKQSAAWPKAPLELQIRAHQMAFSRLEDLIGDGYRFDFINDLHAYRAYIDQEWNPDALEGNRRTACCGPVWDALPPAAREQFARAHEAQLARIKTRQQVAAGGEYA